MERIRESFCNSCSLEWIKSEPHTENFLQQIREENQIPKFLRDLYNTSHPRQNIDTCMFTEKSNSICNSVFLQLCQDQWVHQSI